MTSIVLIDDHKLFRKSLADWLATQDFEVLFEANNGKEFIENLDSKNLPQVALMDINMPLMDGFETTAWIQQNHPSIKVLAISMYDTEMNIIRMLKCGAKGYLLKDSEPQELALAINTIAKKGFYFSDLVNDKLIDAISETGYKQRRTNNLLELSIKEVELLRLICTELTYKEIAEKLRVSPKTVAGYREDLFAKLDIHSRMGLAMYAIKNGIVNP